MEKIRELTRERLSEVELIQVELPGPAEPPDPWLAMVEIRRDPEVAATMFNILETQRIVEGECNLTLVRMRATIRPGSSRSMR